MQFHEEKLGGKKHWDHCDGTRRGALRRILVSLRILMTNNHLLLHSCGAIDRERARAHLSTLLLRCSADYRAVFGASAN